MDELLAKAGWSKSHFAKVCGVDVRTVQRWCREEPDPLAMRYLELVVKLVGI